MSLHSLRSAKNARGSNRRHRNTHQKTLVNCNAAPLTDSVNAPCNDGSGDFVGELNRTSSTSCKLSPVSKRLEFGDSLEHSELDYPLSDVEDFETKYAQEDDDFLVDGALHKVSYSINNTKIIYSPIQTVSSSPPMPTTIYSTPKDEKITSPSNTQFHMDVDCLDESYSPCRTRSGRTYNDVTNSAEKLSSNIGFSETNRRSRSSVAPTANTKSKLTFIDSNTQNSVLNYTNSNISDEQLEPCYTESSKSASVTKPSIYSDPDVVARNFMSTHDSGHTEKKSIDTPLRPSRINLTHMSQGLRPTQPRPLLGRHSPPTVMVRNMRLFDLVNTKPPNSSLQVHRSIVVPSNYQERRNSVPTTGHSRKIHDTRSLSVSLASDIVLTSTTETSNGDSFRTPSISEQRKMCFTDSKGDSACCGLSANINPFTPRPMLHSIKRLRPGGKNSMSFISCGGSPDFNPQNSVNDSWSNTKSSTESDVHESLVCSEDLNSANRTCCSLVGVDGFQPATKRLRVSDMNVSRYAQEFLEIRTIACGEFGTVKLARHRLDGIVYAIKVTKNCVRSNTYDERVTMNEVFANSAFIKNKHVVRYYNSWVEKGRVYIQNEYCEGGSLSDQIEAYRHQGGSHFPEADLKRLVLHVCKGLDYIHSKQLVHLDIKPENILISLDHPSPTVSPHQQASNFKEPPTFAARLAVDAVRMVPNLSSSVISSSTRESGGEDESDSGMDSNEPGPDHHVQLDRLKHGSSPLEDDDDDMSPGNRLSYKIGDLGHVAQIYGDYLPEEGDCRYMAPELLLANIDRELLPKADIFSLGLSLFEAASLRSLPRNSADDSDYECIKKGQLPEIPEYSKEFNQMIRWMVNPDPICRPSPYKLLCCNALYTGLKKSRSQLLMELREVRCKVRLLETELSGGDSQFSHVDKRSR